MPHAQLIEVPAISPRELKERLSKDELAAIAADLAELALEASRQKGRRKVKLTTISFTKSDVFRNQIPAFLTLLRPPTQHDMPQETFVGEALALLELREQPNPYAGTYIYSLTVVDPVKVYEQLAAESYAKLPPAYEAQLKVGYLHHEFLYSAQIEEIRKVLVAILRHAKVIEISLKPNAAAFAIKKRVTLSQPPFTHANMVSSSDTVAKAGS